MSIKPLADRVLIEPTAAETKTASGLYIPDNAKETPSQGKVVAIGNDEDLTVKVGDTVIYGKFSGTGITHEGTDFLIMPESEILAII